MYLCKGKMASAIRDYAVVWDVIYETNGNMKRANKEKISAFCRFS